MRIKSLSDSLEKAELDVYLVTRESNVFYLAGTISGGVLIISSTAEPVLLVPRLNLTIAQDQADGIEVKPFTRQNMLDQITNICNKLKASKIGFDELSLKMHEGLVKKLNGTQMKAEPNLMWEMRKAKDDKEIKMIKTASKLSVIGMEAIRQHIKEGVREYEVAAEAAYAMRKEGAEDNAFPFIVASGPRSAYPHAGVTDRKIRKGDFVTIDMGAKYQEYCTDLTRTFIIGSPSNKKRNIYETVEEANAIALPTFKEDAKGVEVDKKARDIIEKKGFGEYFIHSLGHGVGLEVHEPPSVSRLSKDILKEGNVVTNEPGIYISGFGGVRIEDTVLITNSGPKSLTKFDREIDAMII